jgi:hypothetical protein
MNETSLTKYPTSELLSFFSFIKILKNTVIGRLRFNVKKALLTTNTEGEAV